MHSPTIPLGLRAYFWRNAHVEYQLWPAYNFYYDRLSGRYYNGFDLYNELRTGYRVDFTIAGIPFLQTCNMYSVLVSFQVTNLKISPKLSKMLRYSLFPLFQWEEGFNAINLQNM